VANSEPCDADPRAESAPRYRVGICPYAHKIHCRLQYDKTFLVSCFFFDRKIKRNKIKLYIIQSGIDEDKEKMLY
jgi:hypothetical protein